MSKDNCNRCNITDNIEFMYKSKDFFYCDNCAHELGVIKWKIINAQIVAILGTAQELKKITFIALVSHCVSLAIDTVYKRPCKRGMIMEMKIYIKTR